MIDTARLYWSFWRLLRGRGDDILTCADRVRELAPSERKSSRPALRLEGEEDRILKLEAGRSPEQDKALISGAPIDHGPTLAYDFSNVAISDPFLYRDRARGHYGGGRQGPFLRAGSEWRHLPQAHLVTCKAGSDYFGHFMWDNLPMELLPGAGETKITLSGQTRWHEEDYRRLYGLPWPETIGIGRVDRLTVYDDRGQNSFRESRYRTLRERLRRSLGNPGAGAGPPGVFVRRGETGAARALVNEARIIAMLEARGFDIIDPDRLSGEEIARRTLDARVIVGVDGSHVAHTLYTVADGGTFLILQPPDRFSMIYKEFTDRLALTYAFLVGAPAPGGFEVDPDRLSRLLDRL